jgi:hypothetical protein
MICAIVTVIKSRRMGYVGYRACMRDEKYTHTLVDKPKWKRPLGRSRRR